MLIFGGLFLAGCRPSSQDANPADSVETPAQVLKDFVMNDVTNQVKTMTLQAPEARIFDVLQVADLDQPIVLFYKNGHVSSQLTAPKGRVKTDTHDMDAWGGVTVVSSDSSTLTTDRMHYSASRQKITSQDAVRLEKPDSITDGIGLETDPDLHSVKIGHQKVRFKKGMEDQ